LRAVVVLAAFTLLASAFAAPTLRAQSASGNYSIFVKAMSADFAPESWKDEAPFAGMVGATTPLTPLPAGYTGVYQNPYAGGPPHDLPQGPVNAWGYSMNLTIDVLNGQGQPLTDPSSNYLIDANVKYGAGEIPSKIAKLSATEFRAQFDLDGEAGKPWPALYGGDATVAVDVYQQPPTAQKEKVGSGSIVLHSAYATPDLPAIPFPINSTQVYSDLGQLAPLDPRPAKPSDTIPVAFSFGVPNATAKLVLVSSHAEKATTATTDAAGVLRASVKPSDVVAAGSGGLLVIEANLVGDRASMTVANGLVVVPVQNHATTITAIERETRTGPTDPAATMRVTVLDPDAGAQGGSSYGSLLVMNGPTLLQSVPFAPTDVGTADANHRYARYLASAIASAKVSQYQLYSVLFDKPGDFYSIASAVRGISVTATSVGVQQGQSGVLPIGVRNLNDNGDANGDVGLGTTVHLALRGLPGGANFTQDLSLAEATGKVVDVPFTGGQAGSFRVVINATSDEIQLGETTGIDVKTPPGPLDNLLSRFAPGPEPLVALALVGVAAALVRARRA
jgi:hypothetical protein